MLSSPACGAEDAAGADVVPSSDARRGSVTALSATADDFGCGASTDALTTSASRLSWLSPVLTDATHSLYPERVHSSEPVEGHRRWFWQTAPRIEGTKWLNV